MSQLTLAVLGKALPRDAPRFLAILAGDDPYSHPRTHPLVRGDLLVGRLRVLDGRRTDRSRRHQSGLRRARYEDPRKQLARQGGRELEVLELVERAVAGHDGAAQQVPDDERVLDQSIIALVV